MHYLLINNHRTFGDFYEDLLGASALSRRDGADLQVAGNLTAQEASDAAVGFISRRFGTMKGDK